MPTSDVALAEPDARKQAREEREFYVHAATFVVVMSALVAVNLLATPGNLWVLWPLMGWGIGLVSHGFGVFGSRLGDGWVERRTRELMGEEASEARLRALLDETLDARAVPAGAPQDVARLQRRIEHLEAIVTATDPLAAPARDEGRLDLDGLPDAAPDPAGRNGRSRTR